MTHPLELQATHADLMRLHPGPWYLDRCNATGVEVRDVRGDVVYMDDFEFGPEHGPSFIETVTSRSVALARYLVAMSHAATISHEKEILPEETSDVQPRWLEGDGSA